MRARVRIFRSLRLKTHVAVAYWAPPGRAGPSLAQGGWGRVGPSWVPCGAWRHPRRRGHGRPRPCCLAPALSRSPLEVRVATGCRPRTRAATTDLLSALPGPPLGRPSPRKVVPAGAFSFAHLRTLVCYAAQGGPTLRTPAPGPRGDRLQISLGAGPGRARTPVPQTSHLNWRPG